MKTVPASELKRTCLRLLDEVRETGQPVVITRRGHPVAQLIPFPLDRRADWCGALRGTGRILGDLVAPAAHEGEWAVLRP